MKKQLLVGILFLFAMLSGLASAWADVFINNDTNVTIQYQFKQAGQDWSQTVSLNAWDHHQFRNIVQIRFQARAGVKTYNVAPDKTYRFKETSGGNIDLFQVR